jgi:CubicO group peptidase (beta-lactamase class C family)
MSGAARLCVRAGGGELPTDELARITEGLVARYPGAVFAAYRASSYFEAAAEGASTDAPFHMASIDKLITAAAVVGFVREGVVRLDGTAATYLPAGYLDGLHQTGGIDAAAGITIRQLLAHATGLADCYEDAPAGGKSLMQTIFEDGDRSWTRAELINRLRDGLKPWFKPSDPDDARARIRYCDTNYQILIEILERVGGRPYAELASLRILEPLGMDASWVVEPGDARLGHALPVRLGARTLDMPKAIPCFPSAYAAAADLRKLALALMPGGALEAEAAIMGGQYRRFGFPTDAAAARAPSWPIEYGLGLMRFKLPRIFTGLRALPALYGHTGSTGSWLFFEPGSGLVLCGSANDAAAGAVPYRTVPAALAACLAAGSRADD